MGIRSVIIMRSDVLIVVEGKGKVIPIQAYGAQRILGG
jgi:uncharacterized protein YuzE